MDAVLKYLLCGFLGYATCVLWGIYWKLACMRVESQATNMMLKTLLEVKTKEVQMMLRVQEIVKENEKKA